ncbi:sensor domain-containing diguanylate cyclase [Candidatus Colwellia aromaticivorans]|uniref:sensor domain-containing diguanylate cyclase n=1 Tax=Candidatus Colwellia aromaticivorans TaxID=2267621 RepID=UPI000DF3295E|nr:GGDEF domain-containing protein [Candidatus Colwellia aromaticivorans]
MITIGQDKLEASLELSQLVLNHMGAYVSVKGRDKKYIYANQKLTALFKENFDSILSLTDSELFDFSTYSDVIDSDERVLNFGDSIEKKEVSIIKLTDEKKVYLSSKKPIFNIHREIVGVLCVSTDITESHYLQKKLEIEATTDPLTGLFNRRVFFKLADQFLSESIRHNKNLSLIMIDIDLFKGINDEYGHLVGDHVIQFVAAKAKSLLRKEDIIARVGGEEYAVLLPNTHSQSAQLIAEKIRMLIDSSYITGDWSGEIQPKVSLGVSTYTEGDKEFYEIYSRSDKALYQAKSTGRNKICIYEKIHDVASNAV